MFLLLEKLPTLFYSSVYGVGIVKGTSLCYYEIIFACIPGYFIRSAWNFNEF